MTPALMAIMYVGQVLVPFTAEKKRLREKNPSYELWYHDLVLPGSSLPI